MCQKYDGSRLGAEWHMTDICHSFCMCIINIKRDSGLRVFILFYFEFFANEYVPAEIFEKSPQGKMHRNPYLQENRSQNMHNFTCREGQISQHCTESVQDKKTDRLLENMMKLKLTGFLIPAVELIISTVSSPLLSSQLISVDGFGWHYQSWQCWPPIHPSTTISGAGSSNTQRIIVLWYNVCTKIWCI